MQPVKPEPVAVPAVEPVDEVLPPVKVDMAALRAIVAGNIAPVSGGPLAVGHGCEPVVVVDQVDSAPCPHVEWLEQEGESYACRLSAGHKGKCARGERIA